MKFIPYPHKIHFEPINGDSIILGETKAIEAGTVVAVGEGVEFVKAGDIVFFLNYGAEQTPKYDGEQYWTVADDKAFIMGKIEI